MDTHLRKAIPADMRLAITLHHLADGASFSSIKYHWRVGKSTARQIVYDTCNAIWEELMPVYARPPDSVREWRAIAREFQERWNFPCCIGALDGKHIRIQAPPRAGSEFYNYKQFHSINLMAICDADLKFRLIDVGQAGRWSDSGVFEASTFGGALLNEQMVLPRDGNVHGWPNKLSYCFVADEAFPLKTWMMRPFPGKNLPNDQRIFNFRLSRARRTIENAFGVLSARWRLLHKPIIGNSENVVTMVKAMCVLHNVIKTREPGKYTPVGYVDTDDTNNGQWRNEGIELGPMEHQGARNSAVEAKLMRENFCSYFNSPVGKLPWQDVHINRTS